MDDLHQFCLNRGYDVYEEERARYRVIKQIGSLFLYLNLEEGSAIVSSEPDTTDIMTIQCNYDINKNNIIALEKLTAQLNFSL